MRKVVEWIEQPEKQAATLYTEASISFEDDPVLYPFLVQLARDGSLHARLMGDLADYLRDNQISIESPIRLKQTTIDLVESPLKQGL